MAAPTRVLLVRHGQSTWNAQGRWQGQADPPLTELGLAQARAAVGAVGSVDMVVASDLMRALQTGEILASALGLGPVVVNDRLRERHVGEWTGLTRVEIEAGWPGYLHDHRRPVGWEDSDVVAVRALTALMEIHEAWPGADVVAISHSGVMRAVEQTLDHDHGMLPNLGAREVIVQGRDLRLGNRHVLIDEEAVAASVERASMAPSFEG